MTTFTVESVNGGQAVAVTIESIWTTPGVKGLVERLIAPWVVRRIYKKELLNLTEHTQNVV